MNNPSRIGSLLIIPDKHKVVLANQLTTERQCARNPHECQLAL